MSDESNQDERERATSVALEAGRQRFLNSPLHVAADVLHMTREVLLRSMNVWVRTSPPSIVSAAEYGCFAREVLRVTAMLEHLVIEFGSKLYGPDYGAKLREARSVAEAEARQSVVISEVRADGPARAGDLRGEPGVCGPPDSQGVPRLPPARAGQVARHDAE